MNIYARYFDQETVVSSFEELISFLTSIPEINVTTELLDNVKAYIDSPLPYPKRYKLRPRVYFILIKTTAENIQEFKNNGIKEEDEENSTLSNTAQAYKEECISTLTEINPGWYKATITIKRMVLISELQKYQYQDNTIKAYINAESPIECYNRLLDYLDSRDDLDPRSQIPSAKSSNFNYRYIGEDVHFLKIDNDEEDETDY